MGYVNREIDNIINRELKKDLSLNQRDELKKVPRYNYHKGLAIGYRNYNIMQTVIMKLCFLFYK